MGAPMYRAALLPQSADLRLPLAHRGRCRIAAHRDQRAVRLSISQDSDEGVRRLGHPEGRKPARPVNPRGLAHACERRPSACWGLGGPGNDVGCQSIRGCQPTGGAIAGVRGGVRSPIGLPPSQHASHPRLRRRAHVHMADDSAIDTTRCYRRDRLTGKHATRSLRHVHP